MAFTQGDWSKTSVNGCNVWECDTTCAAAGESDNYTKPVNFIDYKRPWMLLVNTAAATLDGSALPVDIWGGWTDEGLSGDTTTVAWDSNDGGELAAAVIDDCKSTALGVRVIPDLLVTPVVSTLAGVRGFICLPPMPYYVFNLDGASTLSAAACHWVIIQAV